MFQCRRKTLLRQVVKVENRLRRECYHSFPDPSEVPLVSSTLSTHKKTFNKDLPEFSISQNFRLDRPFAFSQTKTGSSSNGVPKTHATKLPNGITVASIDTPGLMTTFSFLVQTGSAFEIQKGSNSNQGAAQMLELLAFRSTKTKSHEQMTTEIGQLGGAVQCIASRDGLYYCMDVLRENIDPALDILADSVLNPIFTVDEIEECKEIIVLQQTELPAETFSRDAVQMAAYKGSPMGNTHFCPQDKIPGISKELIIDYKSRHFVGENTFLTASGIEHDLFVDLVSKKFKNYPKGERSAIVKSKFVGGMHAEERELKEPVVKISMAFEVGGWLDPLLIPACVLQQLLGGGSSFSAGGPGKGMYTRLYRDVLNTYGWVESAEAFMSVANDSGIMGIDASCSPEYCLNLVRVIVHELTKLAYVPVSDEELNRAKKMLKSFMMMQLESRLVQCEDIARQYASFGFREDPASVCLKIDAVTKADLMAVARRLLLTPPAVGCVGFDISQMPNYSQILKYTTDTRSEASQMTLGR